MLTQKFKSKYFFSTQKPVENFSKKYEAFLYNREKHLALQSEDRRVSCYLLRPEKHAILAEIHFFVETEVAISGIRSPFGALCFDNKLDSEVLFAFVEYILNVLKSYKLSSAIIKSYAGVYCPEQSARLMNVLINKGFQMTEALLNLHIPVTEQPFEALLHKMEKRKLVRGRLQGWTFQQESLERMEECYAFIEQCRIKRNQDMRISRTALEQTFEAFPLHFRIFSIREKGRIIALTVMVRAGKKIWYNFLPASDPSDHHLSPMVYLLEQVYAFCYRQDAEVLDMGTSELNKVPLYGLQTFKKRLGAVASAKPTYYIEF